MFSCRIPASMFSFSIFSKLTAMEIKFCIVFRQRPFLPNTVISKLHWGREDTKFMDWKWDMLFTRHLGELQNICKHFCHCHFRFSSEICVVFTLQQKLLLSLIMYIAVPSSVGREECGKENGWFELQSVFSHEIVLVVALYLTKQNSLLSVWLTETAYLELWLCKMG